MYFYKIRELTSYACEYIIIPKFVFDYLSNYTLLSDMAMYNWRIGVIDNEKLTTKVKSVYDCNKKGNFYTKIKEIFDNSGLSLERVIAYTEKYINGQDVIFTIKMPYMYTNVLVNALSDVGVIIEEKYLLSNCGIDIEQFMK